jgi:cytoskeletal protein CcmA (bactofilin family)
MGWFDNEQQEGKPNTAPAPQGAPPPRPLPSNPAKSDPGSGGSTLGREIHIDGTIVCQEDLTIVGRVDGTIRAKGTLVIAKEADVHAQIDGQRVMVHGKVDGNVQGEERVTLGGTARLIGNIETPTLEIVEGAVFRGTVEMKQPNVDPARKPAPTPIAKPAAAADSKPAGGPDSRPPGGPDSKPAGGPDSRAADKAEEPKAAQKQAMS